MAQTREWCNGLGRRFAAGLLAEMVRRRGGARGARIHGEMESVMKRVGFKGMRDEFFRHLNTDPQFFFDSRDDLIAGVVFGKSDGRVFVFSSADGAAPGAKPVEEEGVYVVEGGRVKFQPVVKGIAGGMNMEIVSGLNEGQEIVSGPYSALRELKDGDQLHVDKKAKKDDKVPATDPAVALRKKAQDAGNLVEHAIDVLVAVGAAEGLGQLDGFVDRDAHRRDEPWRDRAGRHAERGLRGARDRVRRRLPRRAHHRDAAQPGQSLRLRAACLGREARLHAHPGAPAVARRRRRDRNRL